MVVLRRRAALSTCGCGGKTLCNGSAARSQVSDPPNPKAWQARRGTLSACFAGGLVVDVVAFCWCCVLVFVLSWRFGDASVLVFWWWCFLPVVVSRKSERQEHHRRVSHKSVPQKHVTRVSHKSLLQEGLTRALSQVCLLQEYLTRALSQECHTKTVLQGFGHSGFIAHALSFITTNQLYRREDNWGPALPT